MAARNRKAEYRARIARGLARGLTRSQARGHPRPGEAFASEAARTPPDYDRRLELGVRYMREGRSLARAARSVHASPERLRRYAIDMGVVERHGRRYAIVDDDRVREVRTFSQGRSVLVRIRGYAQAAKWGAYMSAVGQFLATNDPRELLPFEGEGLVDTAGRRHPFETRPNVLYRLNADPFESYEQIYKIVV